MVKSNNGKLAPAEIRSFKKALLLKRAELLGDVKSMEDEVLRRDSGNLSHMPIHLAELGSDNYQMEHTLCLVDSDKRLLIEIDNALYRIETGEYGKCQIDGVAISKARLKAIPWASFCIECASLSEKKHFTKYGNTTWKDFSFTIDFEADDDKYYSNKTSQIINEDILKDID